MLLLFSFRSNFEMARPKSKTRNSPDIVIITGLSGSGMTAATNTFEDLGYFCVDNMPLMLLPTFARLVSAQEDAKGRIERAALVISFREGRFLDDFAKQLRVLRARGLSVSVIFFEASDEILARRFSETRRPHPADRGKGLFDAIGAERAVMLARALQSPERSRTVACFGAQLRAQVRPAAGRGTAVRCAASTESFFCRRAACVDRQRPPRDQVPERSAGSERDVAALQRLA